MENYTTYTDIADFYDRVRASLQIDTSVISDTKINYPEYAPLAERQIKKKLTNWETLVNDDLTDLQTAVVLQTAINCYSLIPSNIKVKQTANMKIEYKDNTNPTSLIDNLVEKLNEILIVLTDADEDLFIGFLVT
jgi:hypothetical protein